jgi:hypothetical protein
LGGHKINPETQNIVALAKLGQFRKIIHQLEQEFTSKFRLNRILFRTFSKEEYIDKVVVALDLKLVPKKFQLKPFLRTAPY